MKYSSQARQKLDSVTKEFSELMLPQVLNYLDALPVTKLIDIGCGSGRFSEIIAKRGIPVVGLDRNALQIREAELRAEVSGSGARYVCASVDEFYAEAGTYDVALLIYVVLDCQTPAQVNALIAKASQLLKPGGRLIIGDCHPHNIERENDTEVASFVSPAKYSDLGAVTESKVALTSGKWVIFRPNYHYSLQFIFQTLRSNDFGLTDIAELSAESRFPTHLVLLASKHK